MSYAVTNSSPDRQSLLSSEEKEEREEEKQKKKKTKKKDTDVLVVGVKSSYNPLFHDFIASQEKKQSGKHQSTVKLKQEIGSFRAT